MSGVKAIVVPGEKEAIVVISENDMAEILSEAMERQEELRHSLTPCDLFALSRCCSVFRRTENPLVCNFIPQAIWSSYDDFVASRGLGSVVDILNIVNAQGLNACIAGNDTRPLCSLWLTHVLMVGVCLHVPLVMCVLTLSSTPLLPPQCIPLPRSP